MPDSVRNERRIEFGDFQTPQPLARSICRGLGSEGFSPASIIEPTCGRGNLLFAALAQFPETKKAYALDINSEYIASVRAELQGQPYFDKVEVLQGSFFDVEWRTILAGLSEPILIIGNPPWVTNAGLGVLGSSNLPEKTNFQDYRGLDGLTGKSNFDISEWMLMKMMEWIDTRIATVAMLCKTSVARKALVHAWRSRIALKDSTIRSIDANADFGASVSACLLVCNASPSTTNTECRVYGGLEASEPTATIGYRDGWLLSDPEKYESLKHLQADEDDRWRSGIKHDCSAVMELTKEDGHYRNGFGELARLEDDYVYPMLKSSDLASGKAKEPTRWMLITQRFIGEDTAAIEKHAPATWRYLNAHAEHLDRRRSRIYRNRPSFSIFGVGVYSFSPWKVAISGFSKRLQFTKIGPHSGKPVVLDDTCYFLSCETEVEADCLCSLLNSEIARDFYGAFIFWDAKRPITVDLLRRLDLLRLAETSGLSNESRAFLEDRDHRPAQGCRRPGCE
jgi:hypothetical protein